MSDQQTIIKQLFDGAVSVIPKLGNPFTAHAFVRTLTRNQQAAFIDLLTLLRDDKQPFAAAHEVIDSHLQTFAPEHGFHPAEEQTLDTDWFGKTVKSTIYWQAES